MTRLRQSIEPVADIACHLQLRHPVLMELCFWQLPHLRVQLAQHLGIFHNHQAFAIGNRAGAFFQQAFDQFLALLARAFWHIGALRDVGHVLAEGERVNQHADEKVAGRHTRVCQHVGVIFLEGLQDKVGCNFIRGAEQVEFQAGLHAGEHSQGHG